MEACAWSEGIRVVRHLYTPAVEWFTPWHGPTRNAEAPAVIDRGFRGWRVPYRFTNSVLQLPFPERIRSE